MVNFLAGVLTGIAIMLLYLYVLAGRIAASKKTQEKEDENGADWWKDGSQPPF